MTAPLEELAALRSQARATAKLRLIALGFTESEAEKEWTGPLILDDNLGEVPVRVSLPSSFPDALPVVVVRDLSALPRQIAHIERNGKICIAPSSGVLIDADRAEVIIDNALAQARKALARGMTGESDADLRSEFDAYWETSDKEETYSICDPGETSRTIVRVRVEGEGFLATRPELFADKEADARSWATNLGATVTTIGDALFLPLVSSFDPPPFGEPLSVGAAYQLVRSHASPEGVESLAAYLASGDLPKSVLVSMPEALPDAGPSLVALRFDAPAGSVAKLAQKGFRPGKIPLRHALQATANHPVGRPKLVRLDRPYLTARGGATKQLGNSSVAVIGVGAVGSELALNLGSLGVGRHLLLIDPDRIKPANVHRYPIGIGHLDMVRRQEATPR